MYEKIEQLCVNKKITIGRLENELGFGKGTVSKWRGSSPSVWNLKKVADYFDVSIDYLVGREE